MLDKRAVCEALKALRASRPEFANYSRFTEVSTVHRATVESTEKGTTLPGIDTIDKWVTACGSTLSKFFAQLESASTTNSASLNVLGYEPYYELLTRIIKTGKKFYIDGIHANLIAMAAAAEHDEKPPQPSPEVDPKEGAVSARASPGKRRRG